MLIALLKHDKLKLIGQDGLYTVSSYTSFKAKPAVYLTEPLADGSKAVFFSDVLEVNGVKVEYDDDSHLLDALGPLKRPIQLPQPGDKVVYTLVETDYSEEEVNAVVKSLRLHSHDNPTRSLQIKLENSETVLELTDIVDIERDHGGEQFNRSKFQRCYVDYMSFSKREPKSES